MVPTLVRGPVPKRPFVPPDLVILNANSPADDNPGAPAAPPGPAPSKKGKKLISAYDGNRTWKAENAAEFPWAKPEYSSNGDVCNVSCVVCSAVCGRLRLVKNKRDNLLKHVGMRSKATRNYVSPDNEHWQNDKEWIRRGLGSPPKPAPKRILSTKERSRKQVQFVVVFDLLQRGRPMTDYPFAHTLLQFLNLDLPRKHWCQNSGWDIARSIRWVIDEKVRSDILKAPFVSVSCDEVTSIANETWISIHVYLCEHWARKPLLLCCKQVSEGCNSANVARMVTDALMVDGGMTRLKIGAKLISFGADGASVFQGCKGGVTKLMVESISPFLPGHHCMAHQTNLAVATLGSLGIVAKLETRCASLYSYFARSPKRYLASVKLAEELH
jgi:hypothetical protein